MNNKTYRLVYSRLRGMVVAVGETATAAGKSAGGETRARRRSMSHASGVAATVALLSAVPTTVQAQIAPTPSTSTHVIQTPNGLPQVNIAPPSGAGVSVNTYNQFDVSRAGAILNNSSAIVNTQQAGYINGNPNFGPGQSARIIVNQVNSTAASQIRGYVEVAGPRAQVVLANPAGIVVDGGGFINTSRATLTTGQPHYGADGSLAGFNISRGLITVEGAGLNASNVDQVDLISRAVQANSKIYAKRLNVIAGANRVNHDTLATTAIHGDGATSAIAIDVGHLGGMYADRVFLVSNENGVGVAHAGTIAAQVGDLTLQSNGRLVLTGKTSALGNIAVSTAGGIENSGTTASQQSVSLNTGADVVNKGELTAQMNVKINAGSLNSTGTLGSGVNSDGSVGQSGDLNIETKGLLDATGQNLAGGNASLKGGGVNLADSRTAANGNLSLTATTSDVNLTHATTSAMGTLTANAAEAVINDHGNLSSQSSTTLTAGSLSNQGGTVSSQGPLSVQATGQIANQSGTLVSESTIDLDGGAIANNQGTIQSAAKMTIDGTSLDNTAGRITSLNAEGLELTTSGQLTNALGTTEAGTQGGVIGGNGDVTVNASSITNTQGGQISGKNLRVDGKTLDNSGGQIGNIVDSNGDVDVTMTDSVTNANGTISSARDLSVSAETLLGGGEYNATRDAKVKLEGDFAATPDFRANAGHDLTVTLPGTFDNRGNLQAHNNLSVDAGDIINSGELSAGGLLHTRSDNLTNTGRIVGGSASLNADGTVSNVGPTALIGGTDRDGLLEVLAKTIENRDDTTATDTMAQTAIFGMGKVVLAGGKDASGNYTNAALVNNESALIESGGGMEMHADKVTNTRRVIQTSGYTSNVDSALLEQQGISMSGRTGQIGVKDPTNIGGVYTEPPHGGQWNSIYQYTTYTGSAVANTVTDVSPAAQIISGGELDASSVGTLQNYWSNVAAVGNVKSPAHYDADGWAAKGQQAPGVKVTYSGQYHYNNYDNTEHDWQLPFGDAPFVTSRPGGYAQAAPADVKQYKLPSYDATWDSNRTISGTGVSINNTAANASVPSLGLLPGQSLSGSTPSTLNGRATTPVDPIIAGATALNVLDNLTIPQGGLFKPHPAPNAGYAIETNPAFTNQKNFLSSDYFFQQIGVDLTHIPKRLGDGFYEQQLVRNELTALTGKAVLGPYTDLQSMYQSLMANGAELAKPLNLPLGASLSAEQVSKLTSNVIMMETRVVDGQSVLVPVVYLAKVNQQNMDNGPRITAQDIDFKDAQMFTNSGTVKAGDSLSVDGKQIDNAFGALQSGGLMTLTTTGNVDLTSANVKAGSLYLGAGSDLIHNTATNTTKQVSRDGATRVTTTLGPTARIDVAGDAGIITGGNFQQNAGQLSVGGNFGALIGGDWTLGAEQIGEYKVVQRANGVSDTNINKSVVSSVTVGGVSAISVMGDLTSHGAQIDLGGGGMIDANGNVSLLTASATSTVNSNSSGSDSHGSYAETLHTSDQALTGTTLTSGDALRISSGKDIALSGSALALDKGKATLDAKGDVNIGAAFETHELNSHETHSNSSVVSSTKVASGIDQTDTIGHGSLVSADSVSIMSGKDINVTGSAIVGTGDVSLDAARHANILAAEDRIDSSEYHDKKESGLMANGGLSVSIGSRSTSDQRRSASVTHTGSMVGSLDDNLTIGAGNGVHVAGSVLHAGNDVAMAGKTVTIDSAYDTANQAEQHQFRQAGVTVGITNPVVAAVQTGQQMAEAAQHVSGDPRLMTLAAATTGLAAKNAYDAVGGDPVKAATSVGINVSLGASKSDSQSQMQSSTAVGSTVSAGRNVTIAATGAGAHSNIDVIGSTTSAGKNAALTADGQVNLQASESTSSLHGTNSGTSAGVGVSLTVGEKAGLGFTASVAGNRGHAHGDSTSWTNTHLSAGDTLRIQSGGDTNLKGAVSSGRQVVADVGGNLNIKSLQDIDHYDSKQQGAGVSVSVCVPPLCTGKSSVSGNVSQQKMNSDYASVIEQSGLKAGDGGFQVDVKGNTDLKGGVIASGGQAVQENLNSLTTATLTYSDIENHAHYDASQVALSGGYSFGGGGSNGNTNDGKSGIGKDQKGRADNVNPVPGTDQPSENGIVALPPVVLSASGDASSTTRSGISGATITITNEATQQQLTGLGAEDSVANLDRDTSDTGAALAPIFDKEKIEAGFEITSQFINQVGTFVENRAKEVDAAQEAAKDPNLTPEQRGQAQQRADELRAAWGAGGSYRRVVTVLSAAAGGNVTGDMGQFMQAAGVTYLQTLGAEQIKALAPHLGGEGSPAHTALHAVLGCAGGAASGGSCGAGALGASAGVVLNTALDQMIRTEGLSASEKEARANLVTSLVAGVTQAMDANAPQAVTAAGVETLYNRQLHPDERRWAKDNAESFAKHYREKTGKVITVEQAREMLLGTGYRLVDAAASKGPGGEAVAVAYISDNGGNLFRATAAEYKDPFLYGNEDRSLTPEQRALPGAVANPALGLGVAAVLTGGLAAAGAAPQVATMASAGGKYAADLYAAYKAAQAGYSLTTAAITGATVSGAVYTGSALGLATLDAYYGRNGFSEGFDDRFDAAGLAVATTVGGMASMFGTAMYGWAGVANSWKNVTTVPGLVIRGNTFALGQAAGKAGHGAVE